MKTVQTKSVKAVDKKKKGQPTIYQSQVLGVNRALKAEQRTLGGCIKTLLLLGKDAGLDAQRIKILRFVQKDDAAYNSFKSLVRTSKKGNYCPFYVLQALNKNLVEQAKAASKK